MLCSFSAPRATFIYTLSLHDALPICIQVQSAGAMVNTEIFAQASRFGMTVKQVPVSHFPRRHGKPTGSKVAVISKAFRELIKMRRMLHTTTPDQPGLFREHASGPEMGHPAPLES